MIKQVLVDLDGTLVDLVPAHFKSFNDALYCFAGFKLTQDEHDQDFNGLPTKQKLQKLVVQNRLDKDLVDKIFTLKQDLTTDEISTLKRDIGKQEMMEFLCSQGIKVSCVSNAVRATVIGALKQVGLADYMDRISSNEDVVYAKPNPSPYLQMMSWSGIGPKDTLIVEDSAVGIISAIDAGAHTWHVKDPTVVTLENIKKILEQLGNNHRGCAWRFVS